MWIKFFRCAGLAGFAIAWVGLMQPATAQSSREIRHAQSELAAMQIQSITRNREYCGYFGYDDQNQLISGPIRRGGKAGCRPPWPKNSVRIIASLHTHGAFDANIASELPSLDDVRADAADGYFGFVATPGGRLWLIDPQAYSIRQICGLGCLPQDSRFISGVTGPIQNSYSWTELQRFYDTQ